MSDSCWLQFNESLQDRALWNVQLELCYYTQRVGSLRCRSFSFALRLRLLYNPADFQFNSVIS